MFHVKPTLFALASAPGKAAISILRLSGPDCKLTIEALCPLPKARIASLRQLTYGTEPIDQAIVLWFPAPHSFTGEDACEFHIHGSRAVHDRLFAIFIELGLEPALPGAFARRALENGRLDLTQAEAIADLVDSDTQAQRLQALKQLDGALSLIYTNWRNRLVKSLAQLEALIDFPDEDLPQSVLANLVAEISSLRLEIDQALSKAKTGQQVREGYRIILLGRPNAGKSSLFNALLGRDASIVTSIAGTTRDVLEAEWRFGNHKALIYDTAGLHESHNEVEREGIRRATLLSEKADLRLWVIASHETVDWTNYDIQPTDAIILSQTTRIDGPIIDRLRTEAMAFNVPIFMTDAQSDIGLDTLTAFVNQTMSDSMSALDFPAATRQRHLDRLRDCVMALSQFDQSLALGFELCAEDLRNAIAQFDALFGKLDVEQVLGEIFSSFCIGK